MSSPVLMPLSQCTAKDKYYHLDAAMRERPTALTSTQDKGSKELTNPHSVLNELQKPSYINNGGPSAEFSA